MSLFFPNDRPRSHGPWAICVGCGENSPHQGTKGRRKGQAAGIRGAGFRSCLFIPSSIGILPTGPLPQLRAFSGLDERLLHVRP
jgi:hypothetical protein